MVNHPTRVILHLNKVTDSNKINGDHHLLKAISPLPHKVTNSLLTAHHHLKVNGDLPLLSRVATAVLHHHNNNNIINMRHHHKTIPINLLHHSKASISLLSNSGVHLPLNSNNSELLLQTNNMAHHHQHNTSPQRPPL